MTEKKILSKEMQDASNKADAFENSIKDLTMDRMNQAPRQETQAPEISKKTIEKSNDVYLKPKKSISSREKFNENYREEYNHAKEYVHFSAVNNEIIGETIDIWTKPFAGMPAEEWDVPCNKPVWGPRYLAEQIKRKYYHRMQMQQSQMVSADGMGQYYGQMAVDTTVQRLDCHPVSQRKSIFMGSAGF